MDKAHYTPGRSNVPAFCYTRRMANSKNLVESWIAAEAAAGRNRTDALKALNKACGSQYRINRTYEWQHKTVDIPPTPRDYMLRVALAHVLETGGLSNKALSPAEIRKLADRLS